jgi:transcription initiation factor TFIIB
MEFEKHFESLDRINEAECNKDNKLKNNCCQLEENHNLLNDMIECRVCKNIITNIVSNAEWKYYGSGNINSQDPTRCGMPVNSLLPESSVGSSVSFKNNNASMNQIRRYQQWQGMPYKERSLYKVFTEITDICKKNHIPNIIINEAKSLYTIISETKISRGANRKGIIAACVYFACKECSVPRSSKEIAEMFSLDTTIMTKGCKKCQEIISMNKMNKGRVLHTESIKPDDFIKRFCNKLNIDENSIIIIRKICEISLDNNIITENTPPSVASGCIFYFIKKNNIDISKKQISQVCKISEVTINKCSKKLENHDDLFINLIS